jgi:hypothetical protein
MAFEEPVLGAMCILEVQSMRVNKETFSCKENEVFCCFDLGETGLFCRTQPDLTLFEFDCKAGRVTYIRFLRLAGIKADFPAMHGAGDAVARHDTLRQRTPLVRAFIMQREHVVVGGAEEGNRFAIHIDYPCTEFRDVGEGADFFPVHYLHFPLKQNPKHRGTENER